MKVLLSGNEAIARGAYEAGIQVVAGYPGTPSSEILENMTQYKEIYSEWSVNEKVAMDMAAGAAYSGRRAMVTTKQVGMNVLSDSLFYAVYTGWRQDSLSSPQMIRASSALRTSRTTGTTPNWGSFPCWNRQTARRQKILS